MLGKGVGDALAVGVVVEGREGREVLGVPGVAGAEPVSDERLPACNECSVYARHSNMARTADSNLAHSTSG